MRFKSTFFLLLLYVGACVGLPQPAGALGVDPCVVSSALNISLSDRFATTHARAQSENEVRIAFATVISPQYNFPNFNLSSAELAGYLRFKNPELDTRGIQFIEPDIVLSSNGSLHKSLEYTIEELRRTKPHIIGISAKIGSQENLLNLISLIKNETWATDSVIVVGNVLATFSSDVLSVKHPDVLFAISDGELMIDSLYRAIKQGGINPEEIPNVSFQMDGKLHQTRRILLDHANQTWLPAFDMLDVAIANHADVCLRATTGCSAHCTFCSIRVTHAETNALGKTEHVGWRSFAPERTAKILQFFQSKGLTYVNMADDEFGNVDWRFMETLADLLIHQNNEVQFNVSMRLDAFWTPNMLPSEIERRFSVLRKLKRAGLKGLFVGAESGSASQLKRYGKGYDVRVNYEALKLLLEIGIQPQVGFIPFDPLVSRRELLENLDFLELEIKGVPVYQYISSPINVMRIQRGTPFVNLMENRGLLGELEENLSFYSSAFRDPRLGHLAEILNQWFRDIIDQRYPVLQLYRASDKNSIFDRDTFSLAGEYMRRMHQMDIDYLRELLMLFPESEYDQLLEKNESAFKRGTVEFEAAQKFWNDEIVNQTARIMGITEKFKKLRDPLAAEMDKFLNNVYRKSE